MTTYSSQCRLRRRGWTLIEILVVMGVGSLIAGTAMSLFFALLLARDTRRAEHETMASFVRLDHQWRADVRAASAVISPAAAAGPWELGLADNTRIEYQSQRQVLQRTVRVGTAITGREEFPLPEGAQVQCHWPAGGRGLAWLSVDYPIAAADLKSRRTRRIEAPLAADWQFTAHK